MMIGIVIVIGVSQLNRTLGAVLSVAFWSVVAAVGTYGYAHGHSLGLPGLPFSRGFFWGLCALFIVLHSAAAWSHAQKKKRPQPPQED